MDLALPLAIVSGVGWGLNMVIVRWAFDRTGARSDVGALVSIGSAAVVATALAVVRGADTSGLDIGSIARFALVGAIAPGGAQVFFMAAIRSIGASRGGVIIGTSPMFGVVLAITFLDESWKVAIIVGTIATVAGGVVLSWNPESTVGLSRRTGATIGVSSWNPESTVGVSRTTGATIGVLFAVLTASMFGIRDVVARHFTGDSDLAVPWAAVIVLTSATLVLLVITTFRTRNLVAEISSTLPAMLWSGLIVGLALPLLLEGLSRGEVGLVAPVNNGAQVLTVVVLAAVFFGRTERSTRIVIAVALVIAGGTLIGVTQ